MKRILLLFMFVWYVAYYNNNQDLVKDLNKLSYYSSTSAKITEVPGGFYLFYNITCFESKLQ
jgi:hypothetical protein